MNKNLGELFRIKGVIVNPRDISTITIRQEEISISTVHGSGLTITCMDNRKHLPQYVSKEEFRIAKEYIENKLKYFRVLE